MSFFASLERLTFYTVSVSLVKKQVNKQNQPVAHAGFSAWQGVINIGERDHKR
jgi:hypothetical protein